MFIQHLDHKYLYPKCIFSDALDNYASLSISLMFCKYKDFSLFILVLKANFKTMPYWLSWSQQILYKEKNSMALSSAGPCMLRTCLPGKMRLIVQELNDGHEGTNCFLIAYSAGANFMPGIVK